MDMKKTILVLSVLVMVLGMAGIANAAAFTLSAGAANPTSRTVYTTFYDIPVMQINVSHWSGPDSITNLTAVLNLTFLADYSDGATGAANDYAIAIYYDLNNNGVVDGNESLVIDYQNISASDNNAQTINLTGLAGSLINLTANTSRSLLIMAKTFSSDPANGDKVSFNLTSVGTVNGTITQTITGATLTVSSTAPMVNLSNGQMNPGAQSITATKSGLVIQHLIFNNTAAVGDTLRSINITPAENMGENADITRIWFVEDANKDGLYNNNASDRTLKVSPALFADDANTKTFFGINGSVQVAANNFLSLLIVYNMGGTASQAEVHRQNITQTDLGSGQAIRAQVSGGALQPESANFTIDLVAANASALVLLDSNADGTIDRVNITFTEAIRINGTLGVCNNTFVIGSAEGVLNGSANSAVNNLSISGYVAGNGTNYLVMSVTNAKNNGLYDTGATAKAYVLNPNGTCGNITDLAGNGLTYGILTTLSADTAVPILVNATTHDVDESGKLNCYNLTFSESVIENRLAGYADVGGNSNISGSNITISGRSGLLIANFTRETARNRTAVVVCFAEASGYDSSATAAVSIAAGAIADTTGNAAAAGTLTAVDKARPIPLTAFFLDDDADGDVDTIKLTFSENVNDNSYDNTALVNLVGGYAFVTNTTNTTVMSATDTANDTIAYLGIREEGTSNNTGVIANITVANAGLFDDRAAVPNEMASASATTIPEYDGAHPVVISVTNPTSQAGWIRTLTGPIVVQFSEPINATYTAARTNVSGVTTTVTNDSSQTDTSVNLTLSNLTDGTNHTVNINSIDAALNNVTTLWGIKADTTMPYLLYAYFNDSDFAYNGKDVAANDELVLVFSEPMREAGTALGTMVWLVNGSSIRQVNGSLGSGAVVVHSSYKEQVRVLLNNSDELVVRGVYNGSFSPDGINLTNGTTSNTITDLAGNPVDSAAAGVRDIMDTVINVTANAWTPISIPYGINSTAFAVDTTGKSSSMYTYNSSWAAVSASQVVPYQAYLLRINESIKLFIQSVARNTGSPTASATGTTVYEGWNMLGVDGYQDNTGTDVTAAGNWLTSLGIATNSKAATAINAKDLDTALNPQALSAGDIYPYASYWVSVGDLTDNKATFTGYGRW